MDIVHHAFIGGVGFTALAAQGHDAAGLGFLAGSVFPDLDVAFMAFGKRGYLKTHQGPTHSLPLAPVYAAAIAALPALAVGFDWMLFLGALMGLIVHVTLDFANTFGIQLLWPVTRRRYCSDALFFIDTVAWLMTLGYYAAVFLLGAAAPGAALVYVLLFTGYALAKFAIHRRVLAFTGADLAIPSALNPLGFFLFTGHNGRLEVAYYNAATGRRSGERHYAVAPPDMAALAEMSEIFRDMRGIARAFHVTQVETGAAGTTLVAQDLGVRNFGGKFGKTVLRFDSERRLVHEMAHI
jgi:membrane-bound metal-dependent hydrolase YbcI (DUF457 family)